MLPEASSYEMLVDEFEWQIPPRFNIGVDCCDKWADGSHRLALIYETRDGDETRYTFDQLKQLSNQFANALMSAGVKRGDRVGIFLAQSPETAIAHLAIYKAGCIAVPLFALFGIDAIQYRLENSGAAALITDLAGFEKLADIRATLPALKTVYYADLNLGTTNEYSDIQPFWLALMRESDSFAPVDTSCDDPAVIIYTSGTTGKAKGALLPHRVLLGHLTGVEMSQQLFPTQATLIWTPADWAWIGGLFDVLLPAWHHGVAVLARRFEKFDATAAFDLMQRHAVSHTFLPPTALKMMRAVDNPQRWQLSLKAVASGGESLGVTINEFYGQTECNVVVTSCAALFAPQSGSIGKPAPGHRVIIVDEDGNELPHDTPGNIAVVSPDPVMFLGYWNNEAATRAKFRGSAMLTGDLGLCDVNGFIRFVGRDDDVITSAGYRIGPAPIEDCLLQHPAVSMAAVIGAPDPQRTEIVMAFIVLKANAVASDALIREIQQHVRTRLAAHEYPREIRFVDALPMTATGKVMRRELRATLV